jgi:hypothetical protein
MSFVKPAPKLKKRRLSGGGVLERILALKASWEVKALNEFVQNLYLEKR